MQSQVVTHFSEFFSLSKTANRTVAYDPSLVDFEKLAKQFVADNKKYVVQIHNSNIWSDNSTVEYGPCYTPTPLLKRRSTPPLTDTLPNDDLDEPSSSLQVYTPKRVWFASNKHTDANK